MEVLLDLGAEIDATYAGQDESTTPLALAAWCGEVETAKFLISKGANGNAKDTKSRNLLHLMTFYLPDRHGHLPQSWHYWIRHGNWTEHLKKMTESAQLLADSGAEIEAKDDVYPKSTPIITAASLGVWRGGAICALLELGADIDDARGPGRDSGIFLLFMNSNCGRPNDLTRFGSSPYVGCHSSCPSGLSHLLSRRSLKDCKGNREHRCSGRLRRRYTFTHSSYDLPYPERV